MNKKLSSEEQNILDKFYIEIEKIEECIPLIQPDIPDWSKVSSELQLIICIESNSLSKLNPDNIRQIFNDRIDSVKEYLNKRIQNTHNYLLKAKYNHFLYCLTRNNQYGNQAIEEYQQTLALYLNNPNQENINLNFQDILNIIIRLTETSKYKTEEFKKQIHNYLKDFKIYYRIKTRIIDSISKTTLFKIKELDYIPELCCDLAKNEIKHRFIEINLQLGLNIAKRLQNTEMRRAINELLGDNEYKNIRLYDGKPEDIVNPHYNSASYIKIIQYYKNANNGKKRDKAVLEYNGNKKNCKLLKIKSTVKTENEGELQKMLEKLFFSIVSSSTKRIIYQLILGNNLMFLRDEQLEEYANHNKDKVGSQLFKPKRIDANNNVKDVEVKEHLRFQLYSLSLSKTINFASDIIMTSFANKKLSYNKVAKILCGNFFGQEMIITRNDQDISYTWFSMIDIGLKSLFEQCKLLLKNKEPDWRFSIDFLSLKFEGILRDMVGLIGGVITKVDDKGNTTDMLLDDLLRSDSINKIFNKDDINLFQYTFTSKGHNIRNNVAHSFYKPQDYTMSNAVLVLLCILRLAKFNFIRKTEPKDN
jgi:hypothetical protein